MFNFADINALRANPFLAKELVKELSVFELMTAMQSSYEKGFSLLDQKCIIDGILSCSDDAKKLLLASSSLLDGALNDTVFRQLFAKGKSFRAALYGNRHFNWYDLFLFFKDVAPEVLNDVINGDDELKLPFYKNPRMDRNLIASIIAGNNNRVLGTKFDFSQISLQERYIALKNSLPVVEVRSDHWVGKDQPDSNERYFRRPLDSAIRLACDLLLDNKNPDSSYLLPSVVGYLSMADLSLNYIDWISPAEIQLIDEEHSDVKQKSKYYYYFAFNKLIKLLDEKTNNLKKSIAEVSDDHFPRHPVFFEEQYFAPCALSITILVKLMDSYQWFTKRTEILADLLVSNNWVFRASAYSYIFQKIDVTDNLDLFDKFLEKFSNDRLLISHAIMNTSHVNIVCRHNRALRLKIEEFLDSIQADERTYKYLVERTPYTFDNTKYRFDEDQFEKFFNSYRRKFDDLFAIKYINSFDFVTQPETQNSPSQPRGWFKGIFK